MEQTIVAQADTITGELVDAYRKQGYIRIPNLLAPEEVERYREAALAISRREDNFNQGSPMIFSQYVNIWTRDEAFRQLATDPRVAGIARRLAGVPLRIWHDQILIKQPKKSVPDRIPPGWPFVAASEQPECHLGLDRPGRCAGRARLHDLHLRLQSLA